MSVVALQSLDVALGKVQGTMGGPEVEGLTIEDNFLPFDRGFTCSFKQAMQGRDIVNNRFGSQASIPGDAYYEVKGKMPLSQCPASPGDAFALGDMLECSGFERDGSFFNLSKNAAALKDMSVCGYIGAVGVSGSTRQGLLSQAHSVMFSPKISFENGKYAVVEFDGKGAAYAIPKIDLYPDGTASMPIASSIPVVMGASISLCSEAEYIVSKMSVDFGVEVTLVKSMNGSFGYDRATISNIKTATFKATIIAQDLGNKNPYELIKPGNIGPLSLIYGNVSLYGSSCQLTDVSVSNDGGIKTMELSGLFIDNDVSLNLSNSGAC